MIRAYVGDFGSGKTLNMVWDAMNSMYRGRHVISNTPIDGYLDPPFKRLHRIKAEFIPKGDDFQKALAYRENCLFLIDEAAVFLPNNYWNKLPPELLVKFHQHRKYHCDFWYTTQGFGHALKRLRDLTHLVIQCRPLWFLTSKLFRSKRFNPAYFHGEPTEKKYKRYFWGSRILYPSEIKRIFRVYDTEYVVDMSAMIKVKGFQQPTFSKTRQAVEAAAREVLADVAIPPREEDPPQMEPRQHEPETLDSAPSEKGGNFSISAIKEQLDK